MQWFYLVRVLFFMRAEECSGSWWWFRSEGTHWLSVTFEKSLQFPAFPFIKLSCLLRMQGVQSRIWFTCSHPASAVHFATWKELISSICVKNWNVTFWLLDNTNCSEACKNRKEEWDMEKNKDLMKASVWFKYSKRSSRCHPLMLQLICYLSLFKQQHDKGNIKSFL